MGTQGPLPSALLASSPPELAYMKHGKRFHHGGLVIQLHSTHASARALGCRMGPTNVFFLQRAFVKNEEEEFLQKHLAVVKELSMRWGALNLPQGRKRAVISPGPCQAPDTQARPELVLNRERMCVWVSQEPERKVSAKATSMFQALSSAPGPHLACSLSSFQEVSPSSLTHQAQHSRFPLLLPPLSPLSLPPSQLPLSLLCPLY